MARRTMFRTLPVLVLLVAILVAAPAYAAPTAPRIPGTRFSESRNWSGYAVQTSLTNPQSGVVTYVKGSWTVSPVSLTGSSAYSASWIGIDGYSSNTVEQIGTEADWVDGKAVYSAWYEMYPKWSVAIRSLTVRPGDVMAAEVMYTGKNGFILILTDTTTGKTFRTTQKSGSAKRSSAEWIVEAPWSGGTLPLADFGTIPFSSATVTINGHTGTISDPMWQYDPLTMVGPTGTTLAKPSALSRDGSAFSMTWLSMN